MVRHKTPLKLKQSCDFCAKRKIKCEKGEGDQCKACADRNTQCVFSLRARKRPRLGTDCSDTTSAATATAATASQPGSTPISCFSYGSSRSGYSGGGGGGGGGSSAGGCESQWSSEGPWASDGGASAEGQWASDDSCSGDGPVSTANTAAAAPRAPSHDGGRSEYADFCAADDAEAGVAAANARAAAVAAGGLPGWMRAWTLKASPYMDGTLSAAHPLVTSGGGTCGGGGDAYGLQCQYASLPPLVAEPLCRPSPWTLRHIGGGGVFSVSSDGDVGRGSGGSGGSFSGYGGGAADPLRRWDVEPAAGHWDFREDWNALRASITFPRAAAAAAEERAPPSLPPSRDGGGSDDITVRRRRVPDDRAMRALAAVAAQASLHHQLQFAPSAAGAVAEAALLPGGGATITVAPGKPTHHATGSHGGTDAADLPLHSGGSGGGFKSSAPHLHSTCCR